SEALPRTACAWWCWRNHVYVVRRPASTSCLLRRYDVSGGSPVAAAAVAASSPSAPASRALVITMDCALQPSVGWSPPSLGKTYWYQGPAGWLPWLTEKQTFPVKSLATRYQRAQAAS